MFSSTCAKRYKGKRRRLVLVECKPDALLVKMAMERLGFSLPIRHYGGKGRVVRALVNRHKGSVGIIDKDPGSAQPKQLSKFVVVREEAVSGLKVLIQRQTGSYIIALIPRLEDWILKAAREAEAALSTYGLPRDPVLLHSTLNLNLGKLERLLKDILDSPKGRIAVLLEVLREVLGPHDQ